MLSYQKTTTAHRLVCRQGTVGGVLGCCEMCMEMCACRAPCIKVASHGPRTQHRPNRRSESMAMPVTGSQASASRVLCPLSGSPPLRPIQRARHNEPAESQRTRPVPLCLGPLASLALCGRWRVRPVACGLRHHHCGTWAAGHTSPVPTAAGAAAAVGPTQAVREPLERVSGRAAGRSCSCRILEARAAPSPRRRRARRPACGSGRGLEQGAKKGRWEGSAR
jgi:hypothetical protein